MDETPSRRVAFDLRVEESTTDTDSLEESLIDENYQGGTCDGESDGPRSTAGMEDSDQSMVTDEPTRPNSLSGVNDRTSCDSVSAENDERTDRASEVDKAEIESFHRKVCEMEACFPELCFSPVRDLSGNSMVVITQRTVMLHSPFGYTSRIRVLITGFQYEVHVLMKKWESGEVKCVADVKELCEKFSADSSYKFCPGINPDHYKFHYYEAIRFDIKSVRQTKEPFARVDSVNCKLWFQLASNATSAEKRSKEVRCSACKRLVTDLDCQRRRTLAESPTRKLNRQSSSSRARLSKMFPFSRQKRKSNAQNERSNMKRKLEKFSATDVTLCDEQHEEMCSLTERISSEDLDKIFLEGSEHGVGELMKEIWRSDSKHQRQQFLYDQSKNGNYFLSW